MTTKISPTEKILGEALELHEKGVSLHSIVRTYPEHKADIEELFASMATISLEKEKIAVPASGLEAILRSIPEIKPAQPARTPVQSPFAGAFASLSNLKFILPIAALALLTGGLVIHQSGETSPTAIAPLAVPASQAPTGTTVPSQGTPADSSTSASASTPAAASPSTPTADKAQPMSFAALPSNASASDRMVASFDQEAANEASIAKENDTQSAAAVSGDKQLSTDPTRSYEN